MPRIRNFLIVAAFDFGTTYSGYAYSYRDNPTKVLSNQTWYSGDASSTLVTLKTPTSVLLDDKGKFHSFGFEAEDKFAALAEEKKHRGWRLFRRFKMMLHNNKNLSRETHVEDIEGRPYPAMEIFAMAIKYLQNHLLEAVQLQKSGIFETDIQYVITVPAIWDDNAKQFMREAAIKAGIDGDRLEMAYESEVAAIWCTRKEITESQISDLQSTGAKYIVIDLGGGTADITVHEKLAKGNVKMIHKASGGAWGGTVVDQQFLGYLEKLYGKNVLEEFQRQHIGDYFELIRNFETKKRSNVLSHNLCTVRMPVTLKEIHCTMNSNTSNTSNNSNNSNTSNNSNLMSSFVNTVYRWFGAGAEIHVYSEKPPETPVFSEKLRMDSSDVIAWFEKSVSLLVQHVRELLSQDTIRNVRTILLVGGFAESRYVQDRLRAEFSGITLTVPDEAGLAVLKGAVLFGHNPGVVTSRVMAHTYGISLYNDFDETKHSQEKKVLVNGKWNAANCFEVFVRVNEEVALDHEVSHNVIPVYSTTGFRVYRTLSENPKYTTDPGCELMGELVLTNIDSVPLKDQTHKVTFMFGHTELLVKVKHMHTDEENTLTLVCLQ